MPYVYLYQCNRCEADVEIVLSKEFRREPGGQAVDFEYPPLDLYEWPPRRVSGLWSHLWCPTCKANRNHVLVELDEPAEHPVQAFIAAEAHGLTGGETGPCPECGTTLLIDLDDQPCPRCQDGRMACIGEYEP